MREAQSFPRRFVFFNRYVYPDHSATSQLLSDLSQRLNALGHSVLLVGSRQRYDNAGAMLPEKECVNGLQIARVGGTRFGRNSLAGRAIDYVSYCLGAAWLLLTQVRSSDTVVLMTDPPLLGAALGPLCRLRGATCVHWLQDLFPEVAEVLLGRWWSGWRTAPLRWIRDRSLLSADHIVAISKGMAARVCAQGVPRGRVLVIENWADDESIHAIPADDNSLRDAWGLRGKFVVGYSGNLGRAHDWRTMLAVAEGLKDQRDIQFVLIGGGRGQQEFADAALQRSLENVSIYPYQPREALALSLCVPDVHWLSLLPGLEGLILPSKIYGIQAAGRPALFIGDPDGEVARMLESSASGWAVAPGDAAQAMGKIAEAASNRTSGSVRGAAARANLEAGRTRGRALNQWVRLLTQG